MIYVTLGTMYLDFPRLVRKIDTIAAKTGEKTVIQTGLGKTLPHHCEHFDFKPREEAMALQGDARIIICHAGIGSVIDALEAGRPLLVVPRLKQFNEHNSDHQLDLARAVQNRGWGRMILDTEDLDDACAHPPPAHKNYTPDKPRLIAAVRETIEKSISARS